MAGLGGLAFVGEGYEQGLMDYMKTAEAKDQLLGRQAFGKTLMMLNGQDPNAAPGFSPSVPSPAGGAGALSVAGAGGPIPGAAPMFGPGAGPAFVPRPPGAPPMGVPAGPPVMPPMQQRPMAAPGSQGAMPPGMGGAPGGGGFDWRQVLQAVVRANPGASPSVIAAAVDQFMPIMNQQAQAQWREQSLFLREQALQMAQERFYQQDQTRRDVAGQQSSDRRYGIETRADTAATAEAGRDRRQLEVLDERDRLAQENRQLRRDLETQREEGRTRLETQRQEGRTSLETQRQTGRSNLETQRQTGRSNLETQRQTGRMELERAREGSREALSRMSIQARQEIAAAAEQGRNERAELSANTRAEIQRAGAADKFAIAQYLEAGRQARADQAETGRSQRAVAAEEGRDRRAIAAEEGRASRARDSNEIRRAGIAERVRHDMATEQQRIADALGRAQQAETRGDLQQIDQQARAIFKKTAQDIQVSSNIMDPQEKKRLQDENDQAFKQVMDNIDMIRRQRSGRTNFKDRFNNAAGTKGGLQQMEFNEVDVPGDYKNDPDGTIYHKNGVDWVKQGNKLKAIGQTQTGQ